MNYTEQQRPVTCWTGDNGQHRCYIRSVLSNSRRFYMVECQISRNSSQLPLMTGRLNIY